jgi:L-lactate dehydrogenase complex protein LldF
MSATMSQFRHSAFVAIKDIQLQSALEGATGKFSLGRVKMLAEVPDVEAMRDHFKAVRSATLARLADHLETFERNATAAGAQVHWAADGAEARQIVLDIAQRHGVKLVTKSKSMATEEIHLNQALAEAGIEPVETDLGEWIIQLAGDPPFHIIVPAIHKTRHQVAEMFTKETGEALSADDIPGMTAAARRVLREKFLAAGLGISGGNLLVAESGSVVLVTNEGNGRLVTSAPPVHIAVVGIEKMAPTWGDVAPWLALLARSSTGQPLTIYTNVITGPARPGDADGPQEVHIVLLDNGRSRQVGTKYEEVLQCIRCGACLNGCPVYREAGGHAYGSPYSGPIGAVISPLLFGLEEYAALPHASSLCGECKVVCPVRIDLPRMLLELRADEVERRLLPWWESLAERAVAFGMSSEPFYRFGAAVARQLQKPLAGDGHLNLPAQFSPGGGRKLPTLAERSFREIWQSGELDN